jgi:plasmid stabilization system protein ParE
MKLNRKRHTVIVRSKAKQMLYAHVRFVTKVSIPAARKLRVALYDAIASLKNMPSRCPEYHTSETSDHYHQLIVGRYKILFTIDHENTVVTVEHILDSRRESNV